MEIFIGKIQTKFAKRRSVLIDHSGSTKPANSNLINDLGYQIKLLERLKRKTSLHDKSKNEDNSLIHIKSISKTKQEIVEDSPKKETFVPIKCLVNKNMRYDNDEIRLTKNLNTKKICFDESDIWINQSIDNYKKLGISKHQRSKTEYIEGLDVNESNFKADDPITKLSKNETPKLPKNHVEFQSISHNTSRNISAAKEAINENPDFSPILNEYGIQEYEFFLQIIFFRQSILIL